MTKAAVLSRIIREAIWKDCIGRSGIGNEFDYLDAGVKQEIESTWEDLILTVLRDHVK